MINMKLSTKTRHLRWRLFSPALGICPCSLRHLSLRILTKRLLLTSMTRTQVYWTTQKAVYGFPKGPLRTATMGWWLSREHSSHKWTASRNQEHLVPRLQCWWQTMMALRIFMLDSPRQHLNLSLARDSRPLRRQDTISSTSNLSGQSSGIGVATAAVAHLLPHPLPFGIISAAIYRCQIDATVALIARNASTTPRNSHATYRDTALSTPLNVSIVQIRTAPIPLVGFLAETISIDIDDLVDIGIRRMLHKMAALGDEA